MQQDERHGRRPRAFVHDSLLDAAPDVDALAAPWELPLKIRLDVEAFVYARHGSPLERQQHRRL
jgi:hypothetical protein